MSLWDERLSLKVWAVRADETFILRSSKGQRPAGRQPRRRGGKSSTRGTSDDHVLVLVVRDRSGTSTDLIPRRADRAQLVAVLAPVLAPDSLLCTDGSSALAAAARQIGVEHRPLNMTSGTRAQGPWHLQNVNAHHGRLKEWMRRFHGVATSYLASYLGWFRATDRLGRLRTPPASLLALVLGAPDHHQANAQRAFPKEGGLMCAEMLSAPTGVC